MALPVYKDYNPGSPWQVTGEVKTIDANGRIRLDYVPLQGSGATAVSISGYTETTSSSPGLTQFYIDYQVSTAYRTALGYVQFSLSAAGNSVTVNYYGVSTIIWADQLNEFVGGMVTESNVAALIHGATAKTTAADADELAISDSADENKLKKMTVANLMKKSLSAVLTGFNNAATAAAVSTADTILSAFEKLYAWTVLIFGLKWTEKILLSSPPAGFVSPYNPLSRNGTLSAVVFYPKGTPASATTVNLMHGTGNSLAAALTSGATAATMTSTITLSVATNMLIDDEVVQITAIGGTTLSGTAITGTALTIVRAQGGTTAAAHDSGTSTLLQIATASLSTKSPVTVSGLSISGAARDLLAYHVAGAGLASIPVTSVQEWGNR